MLATKPLLENLHWETSPDQTHQHYFCEPHNQSEFDNLVTFIRKYGFLVTIQGHSYVCVDVGRYLYWISWDSIEKPNIINRKLI